MFKLKRPCAACPFKKGQGSRYQLSSARLEEIKTANSFQCHKTVGYPVSEEGEWDSGDKPQQCAGLMAVLNRENQLNQIMQVGVRFKALDLSKLDPDNEAYETWDQLTDAHLRGKETSQI